MRANVKNVYSCLLGTAALLAGCAAEPEETYEVTELELGSCADDTWTKSGSAMDALLVQTQGNDLLVRACDSAGCQPMSPTRFAWNVDRWSGADGGAFLDGGGCLLVHVDATALLDGGDLVIEAMKWTSIADACTVEAVEAMRARPCDLRTRIIAVAR